MAVLSLWLVDVFYLVRYFLQLRFSVLQKLKALARSADSDNWGHRCLRAGCEMAALLAAAGGHAAGWRLGKH